MSMHLHNRYIHHGVFHARLIARSTKQLLKYKGFEPHTKPFEYGVPLAKFR